MSNNELYMQRCIDLAKMGAGHVAPNPMVGCVIVHNDTIIGEGFHVKYGDHHAEVNAIASVSDPSLLPEATVYVNLEPCSHFGKTPPCCDLLVAKNVRRVVVGCIDSFDEVSGNGIAALRSAGIEVTIGVLEKESLHLNRRFLTFHNKKRPYIILKWAQSADGFMDIDRSAQQKGIHWITQPETKSLTHKWRHEEAAILVGKNTIANDNPELTCRAMIGNNPTRIVIDQKLRLDYGSFNVGDRSVKTIILTEKEVKSDEMLQFVAPRSFEIGDILEKLHELELQSIIIEGGKSTLDRFIESGLWDEARILTGIGNIENGISAPTIEGDLKEDYKFGKDQVQVFLNSKND